MNKSTLGREQVAEMLGAPPQIRQDLAWRMARLVKDMCTPSYGEPGDGQADVLFDEARAILAELPRISPTPNFT